MFSFKVVPTIVSNTIWSCPVIILLLMSMYIWCYCVECSLLSRECSHRLIAPINYPQQDQKRWLNKNSKKIKHIAMFVEKCSPVAALCGPRTCTRPAIIHYYTLSHSLSVLRRHTLNEIRGSEPPEANRRETVMYEQGDPVRSSSKCQKNAGRLHQTQPFFVLLCMQYYNYNWWCITLLRYMYTTIIRTLIIFNYITTDYRNYAI